jgi:hypothetical protein
MNRPGPAGRIPFFRRCSPERRHWFRPFAATSPPSAAPAMAPAIAAYNTENPRHFIGVYYRRHCLNLILLMVTLTYILS